MLTQKERRVSMCWRTRGTDAVPWNCFLAVPPAHLSVVQGNGTFFFFFPSMGNQKGE